METSVLTDIINLVGLSDSSLYNWLVRDSNIDLYRYCMLLKFIKYYSGDIDYVWRYLLDYGIFKHSTRFISKGMIEFYKNKYYSIGNDTFAVDVLYGEHCGVRGTKYDYDENITKDGIKFILIARYFNHDIEEDVQFVKFLNKSKKLGYSREKFIQRTGVNENFYDKVNDNYCKYISRTTFQQFLDNQKFIDDALACMEFIKALENSVNDTNDNDITVSIKAVNSIIVGTDINKHLASSP